MNDISVLISGNARDGFSWQSGNTWHGGFSAPQAALADYMTVLGWETLGSTPAAVADAMPEGDHG